jgi:hypothetical protein
MLHSEIIAVCSNIHTKHINTLCGYNVEFLDAFAKADYGLHVCLSVCLPARLIGITRLQLDGFSLNLI